MYSYDDLPDYDLLGKFDKAAYESENSDLTTVCKLKDQMKRKSRFILIKKEMLWQQL